MSSIFERLLLKGNKTEVSQPITDDEVEAFFQASHRLDKELTGNERNEDLDKRLKLKEFLVHFTKQRHYFFPVKKCGDLNCKTCPNTSPTFANLSKTPPSTRSNADERNEGNYKSFSDFFLGK